MIVGIGIDVCEIARMAPLTENESFLRVRQYHVRL